MYCQVLVRLLYALSSTRTFALCSNKYSYVRGRYVLIRFNKSCIFRSILSVCNYCITCYIAIFCNICTYPANNKLCHWACKRTHCQESNRAYLIKLKKHKLSKIKYIGPIKSIQHLYNLTYIQFNNRAELKIAGIKTALAVYVLKTS